MANIDRTALGTVDGKDYFWAIYRNEHQEVIDQRLEWRIPDIREAIRAEPGSKILSADYSQIEIKLMAYLSGDPWLKEAINSGRDIHCYLCTDAFGAEMNFDYDLIYTAYKDKSHPRNLELTTLRADFKVVVFGVPYGAGPPRVAFMTGKTVEEAADLINKFFARAKVLKMWLDQQGASAVRYGFTTSPRGRKRFYVRPAADDPKAHEVIAQIQRWAGNHPIQCLAAGTRIFEKNNGYVPIETMVDRVVTVWDGHQWSNAAVVKNKNRKEKLLLELMGGYYIEPSREHQFSVLTPKNKRVWKEPGKLASKNDRVELTSPVPDWHLELGDLTATKSRSNNRNDLSIEPLSKNKSGLGEWLGRIASDGGYRLPTSKAGGTVRLLCAEHEYSILPTLESLTSTIGEYYIEDCKAKGRLKKNGESCSAIKRIVICSSSLARQLHTAGVKRRVPEFIWKDSDLLKGYLRGLFDGDGTVNQDGAVLTFGGGLRHLPWAREVQQALLLLGIRSRIGEYDYIRGGRVNLRVQKYDMPIFTERVGFMNPRKQAAAEQVIGDPCKGEARYGRGQSLRRLEYTGDQVEMYDVILSDTKQFMANGMVVHNSGNVDMLKPAMKMIYDELRALKLTWAEARILFVVHDEIVMQCREELVEVIRPIMERAMTKSYDMIIPDIINKIDVGVGDYWEKV
jgi:intein/homing endonuclease